jgi:hypothetical protein
MLPASQLVSVTNQALSSKPAPDSIRYSTGAKFEISDGLPRAGYYDSVTGSIKAGLFLGLIQLRRKSGVSIKNGR